MAPANISQKRLGSLIASNIWAVVSYSWLNILLIFVPLGILSSFLKGNPTVVFTTNALAIIPLSGLLAYATQVIARDMGDTIGALMNISFGNLVELIILQVFRFDIGFLFP